MNESMNVPLSRRELLQQGLTVAAATALPTCPLIAEGASPLHRDDEQYFIFVELKGGVNWMIGPNAPDPKWLAEKQSAGILFPLAVHPEGQYGTSYGYYYKNFPSYELSYGGSAAIVPFLHPEKEPDPKVFYDKIGESYKTIETRKGHKWHVGFGSQALWDEEKRHYDHFAMVRGVHMTGSFHGPCNFEIFSGTPRQGEGWHAASIVAEVLEKKYGPKLFDNIAVETPTINRSSDVLFAKEPISLTGHSLGFLTPMLHDAPTAELLGKAGLLTDAYEKAAATERHRNAFHAFREAMPVSRGIARKLIELKDKKITGHDLTLDLDKQFELATELFSAGLTRVATLCYGSRNSSNNVDEFGVFDAHSCLYTDVEIGFRARPHHVLLNHCMDAITKFLTWARTERHPVSKKPWAEHVTLVVASEFGRPPTFVGAQPKTAKLKNNDDIYTIGSGHERNGNVYLFAGRGVEGGAMAGTNDNLTGTDKGQGIKPESIVATILALAGAESDYRKFYPLLTEKNPTVLKDILAER